MSKGVSKVGKAIDWEYLNKVVVSADGKRELGALRRAYDDVAATIQDQFTIVREPPSDLSISFKEFLHDRLFDSMDRFSNHSAACV